MLSDAVGASILSSAVTVASVVCISQNMVYTTGMVYTMIQKVVYIILYTMKKMKGSTYQYYAMIQSKEYTKASYIPSDIP
jgi:pimeloyl-CoA synthetase